MSPIEPSELSGAWHLEQTGSSVAFQVKNFWGLIKVKGRFEKFDADGTVARDGTASGAVRIETASLTTGNKKRDEHLRSDEFFDAGKHPSVTVTVDNLHLAGSDQLAGHVRLEAAGHSVALDPAITVTRVGPDELVLTAEAVVDRTAFGMTWSPLGMAAKLATVAIVARFVRS